jgi:chromosome segregation ATPase
MATIDQRVADLEYLLAHLPEDLDARFAGVHTKLAELREAAAVHTHRLGLMEGRMSLMEGRLDRMEGRLGSIEGRLAGVEKSVADVVRLLEERLPKA